MLLIFLTLGCEKEEKRSGSGGGTAQQAIKSILTDNTYSSIEIELLYPEGFKPQQESLDNLRNFILEVANKPDGVTFKPRVIPAFSEEKLSVSQIREFEDNNRTSFSKGSTFSIFMLCTNTGSTSDQGNSRVLGVAYGSSSICLFQETIQDNSGGGPLSNQPSREVLETTVYNHELGHLMGLVNNGTPMVENHQDTENGRHCDVDDCLMFFQVETTADLLGLMNSGIPELDDQCRADLRANGGK